MTSAGSAFNTGSLAPPTPEVARRGSVNSDGAHAARRNRRRSSVGFVEDVSQPPKWSDLRNRLASVITTTTKETDLVLDPTLRQSAPIHLQGDFSLYTEEAIEKREAASKHPKVKRVIDLWWRVLEKNPDETLPKAAYVEFNTKLYKMLVENDDEAALKSAEEDWRLDAGDGTDSMTYEQFYSGFFEMIDTWNPSLEVHDYVDISEELFLGVILDITEKYKRRSVASRRRVRKGQSFAAVVAQRIRELKVLKVLKEVGYTPEEAATRELRHWMQDVLAMELEVERASERAAAAARRKAALEAKRRAQMKIAERRQAGEEIDSDQEREEIERAVEKAEQEAVKPPEGAEGEGPAGLDVQSLVAATTQILREQMARERKILRKKKGAAEGEEGAEDDDASFSSSDWSSLTDSESSSSSSDSSAAGRRARRAKGKGKGKGKGRKPPPSALRLDAARAKAKAAEAEAAKAEAARTARTERQKEAEARAAEARRRKAEEERARERAATAEARARSREGVDDGTHRTGSTPEGVFLPSGAIKRGFDRGGLGPDGQPLGPAGDRPVWKVGGRVAGKDAGGGLGPSAEWDGDHWEVGPDGRAWRVGRGSLSGPLGGQTDGYLELSPSGSLRGAHWRQPGGGGSDFGDLLDENGEVRELTWAEERELERARARAERGGGRFLAGGRPDKPRALAPVPEKTRQRYANVRAKVHLAASQSLPPRFDHRRTREERDEKKLLKMTLALASRNHAEAQEIIRLWHRELAKRGMTAPGGGLEITPGGESDSGSSGEGGPLPGAGSTGASRASALARSSASRVSTLASSTLGRSSSSGRDPLEASTASDLFRGLQGLGLVGAKATAEEAQAIFREVARSPHLFRSSSESGEDGAAFEGLPGPPAARPARPPHAPQRAPTRAGRARRGRRWTRWRRSCGGESRPRPPSGPLCPSSWRACRTWRPPTWRPRGPARGRRRPGAPRRPAASAASPPPSAAAGGPRSGSCGCSSG